MSSYTAVSMVYAVIEFYQMLIVVYVLMSWFPLKGFFAEVYHVLGTVCEPWLGLFRRFIPPIGGTVDVSPIVALLALNLVARLVSGIL